MACFFQYTRKRDFSRLAAPPAALLPAVLTDLPALLPLVPCCPSICPGGRPGALPLPLVHWCPPGRPALAAVPCLDHAFTVYHFTMMKRGRSGPWGGSSTQPSSLITAFCAEKIKRA